MWFMTRQPICKRVPIAGLRRRVLRATKTMPKQLLRIINTPIIQYAVEEAVAAGTVEHVGRDVDLAYLIQNEGKPAADGHVRLADHTHFRAVPQPAGRVMDVRGVWK
jgi:UTP-glucose-1-phosphate uridylyltransferase